MGRVRDARPGGVGFRATGVGLALLFSAAAGCGDATVTPDGYEPTLRYPPRTDPIVLQTPPDAPAALAPPGRFDEFIAQLPARRGRLADPKALAPQQTHDLTAALDAAFGTPAAPTVPELTAAVPDVDLSPAYLAVGSRHFRRLCAQCHGLTGDGRGPSGAWVYPHPRDFRQGAFKSAVGTAKPTAAALVRVLRGGVAGSSMPLFDLIPDDEVRALVAYTVHLSARGETEFAVTKALLDETGESDVGTEVRRVAARVLGEWSKAVSPSLPPSAVPPETADPESVRRGHALFAGTAGCAGCHQDYGRTEAYRYDVWGAAVRVPDLTRGTFRWGKGPADVAAHVRHGIPPSGMPTSPALTDAQVSDLTAFVRDLPHPHRLPADVRDKVLPAVATAR